MREKRYAPDRRADHIVTVRPAAGVRAQDFDFTAHAACCGEARVGSDEGGREQLRECDVRSVVRREVRTELPTAGAECTV
jgi:hypothetical protein